MNKLMPVISVLLLFAFGSCQKSNTTEESFGETAFQISHLIDNEELTTDALIYTNAAGNRYMVTEIQWFITNLKLIAEDGTEYLVKNKDDESVFYVDTDIPESMTINTGQQFPAGEYAGVKFTFGFNKAENQSHRFVNPPESYMFWPTYLGGGYHYMKLNGKWINQQGKTEPFNFHLGIGQEYYDENKTNEVLYNFGRSDSYEHCPGYQPPSVLPPVIGFIHNYFTVELNHPFTIKQDQTASLELLMHIEQWFKAKRFYDHDEWGGAIMQQQDAMEIGIQNGPMVFELRNGK
ncbi:MAG: hypothetical protein PHP48_10780 [Bacteroidales bacterium]|nr:hypothetical protein [Bacteroidales bacterium]